MQPIPLELPLKASEAASLADVLLDQVEGRALTGDTRSRLASRLDALPRSSFTVFPGSLQQDPIHPSVFYIAVGPAADPGRTMLLRVALASSPSSGLFPKSLLIGRMRTNSGREIVINAISFTPEDRENVRTFVERVDRDFAPRPQGTLAALEVTDGGAAAFQTFRAILKSRNVNVASVFSADPAAALWAATVTGWREGYTAATAVQAGQAIDPVFTKYSVAAKVVDEVYDAIQLAKGGPRARFDLEVSLADAPSLTTPKELFACLDQLKSRGKTPQFVAPNLGQTNLEELAEVARSFNATLSIQSSGHEPPEFVERLGKATGGRVNYKISSSLEPAEVVRLAEQLNL